MTAEHEFQTNSTQLPAPPDYVKFLTPSEYDRYVALKALPNKKPGDRNSIAWYEQIGEGRTGRTTPYPPDVLPSES